MQLPVVLTTIFSTTVLALPTITRSCTSLATISDPGFYASASIPSVEFPDDEPHFENQVLQYQPTVTSSSTCTLVANFEAGFAVTSSGPGDLELDVFTRPTYNTKSYFGTLAALPVGAGGTISADVSTTIASFPCDSDIVFEFQLALSDPGDWASVAFSNDAANGFFVSVC